MTNSEKLYRLALNIIRYNSNSKITDKISTYENDVLSQVSIVLDDETLLVLELEDFSNVIRISDLVVHLKIIKNYQTIIFHATPKVLDGVEEIIDVIKHNANTNPDIAELLLRGIR